MTNRNTIPMRTRAAVAALGDAWQKLTPEQRGSIPPEIKTVTIELLSSILKVENENQQPSPNHALILRLIYWLPDREAQEVVAALDELETLRNGRKN